MPYWEMVTRSFKIVWRFKYLWLLAFVSGEAGGGSSFNYSQGQPIQPGTNRAPDFNAAGQQVSAWVNQNTASLLIVAALLIVLSIGFFVLAAVCEGALVRASAEHDAERPFNLAVAWRCGVATMGTIIRFRLLLLALTLPVLILVLALVLGAIAAFLGHNNGAGVSLALAGALLVLVAIPYAIYISFLDRLGTRAVVLEQVGARAAIVRAHRLLTKRLGRVLLVWLLAIAVGIVVGICLGIVAVVIAIPVVIAAAAAYASGSAAFWVFVVIGFLIALPVFLVTAAFSAAQGSTYWTLAFRRLEIDQPPVAYYAYPSPAS
ncbi:MAG: hypothetical protein ABI401_02960 [Candidatus Dormibacter sp.]